MTINRLWLRVRGTSGRQSSTKGQ